MHSKLLIAGALIALFAICALAVAALSLSQGQEQGQISTSLQPTSNALTSPPTDAPLPPLGSVNGTVIDTWGHPLAGLFVTLHLMGNNNTGDQASGTWEVYNLTTTTQEDGPNVGQFVFDNVELVPELKYAYLSTEVPFNGSVYYGYTDNFTLKAGTLIKNKAIVLHLPKEYERSLPNGS